MQPIPARIRQSVLILLEDLQKLVSTTKRLAGWGMYFMAASHVLLASGFESEKSEGGIREEKIEFSTVCFMWSKEDTNGALQGNWKLTQYLPILF